MRAFDLVLATRERCDENFQLHYGRGYGQLVLEHSAYVKVRFVVAQMSTAIVRRMASSKAIDGEAYYKPIAWRVMHKELET